MTILEEKINNVITAIQKDLTMDNYYSALVVAFTLPDITSKLQCPNKYTKDRYVKWFEDYMQEDYKHAVGFDSREVVFLTGEDFYALRCSLLHQGETEIINQKARKHLSNFVFLKPTKTPNGTVHLNMIDDLLQLQVDIFCKQIIEATQKWVEHHKEIDEINDKAKNLIDIHEFNNFIF